MYIHVTKACVSIVVLAWISLAQGILSWSPIIQLYPHLTLESFFPCHSQSWELVQPSLKYSLTKHNFFQHQLQSGGGWYSHQPPYFKYFSCIHLTYKRSFFLAIARTSFAIKALFQASKSFIPNPPCFFVRHVFCRDMGEGDFLVVFRATPKEVPAGMSYFI